MSTVLFEKSFFFVWLSLIALDITWNDLQDASCMLTNYINCCVSVLLLAILTVDHSVVDLETIEALYENVGITAHFPAVY